MGGPKEKIVSWDIYIYMRKKKGLEENKNY
jgi:hypothetical protein